MPRTIIVLAAFVAMPPIGFVVGFRSAHAAEIVAQGTVKSANSVAIHSPVTATILKITAEGPIQRGDIIAVLDSAPFEERVDADRIKITKLRAELLEAERELESAKTLREAEFKLAARRLDVAKLARQTFDAELELKLAHWKSSLRVARAKVVFAERQAERNQQVPASQRDAARLDLTQAQAEMESLQAEEQFFQNSASKLKQAELDLQVEQRNLELLLIKQSASSLGRQQAQLETVKQLLDITTKQLQRHQAQLAGCRIKAPLSGMLLHGDLLAPQVGTRLREGQTIANVSDFSRLQLRAVVPEDQLPRIRLGQPCQVRLDAFPDATMVGRVEQVSATPERIDVKGQKTVRKYAVTVSINAPPNGTTIGLTGVARIRVAD